MSRDRRYRLKHVARIIKKRLKIARQWWNHELDGSVSSGPERTEPHRLHKWNFTCDCKTCSLRPKTRKDGLPHRDKKNLPPN